MAALLVLTLVAFAACKKSTASGASSKGQPKSRPPTPVTAATAEVRSVPIELAALGTVEPINTVAVRAQVGGELLKVEFKEGEEVEQGQKLFQIDSRPYELALAQARANLARDVVNEQNAQLEANRLAPLAKNGVVAQLDYAARVAAWRAAQATVRASRANVNTARVNLGYTTIRSPLAGRTGNLQVDAGNLVQANSATPLVVIRQLAPIYVSFTVPAQSLAEIRRLNEQQGPLRVVASAPGQKEVQEGELTFIDSAVDTSTGTILLKGTFQNEGHALWPGQFVNVTLRLAQLPNAVVIPSQAIQQGQKGPYVFVVESNSTVQMRLVREGPRFADATVVAGVRAGERVITDGQLGLTPGAKVQVKEAPPPRNAPAAIGGSGR